jgi:cbb3-type cytochrome oxidase maturation protein
MTPLVWLILASLGLGAGALTLFLWSLRSGQYEDLDGAAERILFDEVECGLQRKAGAPPLDPAGD